MSDPERLATLTKLRNEAAIALQLLLERHRPHTVGVGDIVYPPDSWTEEDLAEKQHLEELKAGFDAAIRRELQLIEQTAPAHQVRELENRLAESEARVHDLQSQSDVTQARVRELENKLAETEARARKNLAWHGNGRDLGDLAFKLFQKRLMPGRVWTDVLNDLCFLFIGPDGEEFNVNKIKNSIQQRQDKEQKGGPGKGLKLDD